MLRPENLLSSNGLDDLTSMAEWSEEFSNRPLEAILGLQAENRSWSKKLRLEAVVLTNGRLANQMTLGEYAAKRKVGNENRDECQRRARILANEIEHRGMSSLLSK